MNSEAVDEKKIGPYVGAGFQHRVYEYGPYEVIKIPHIWMRLSATCKQKQGELEIVKKYFGDYLPEMSVRPFRNSYCYMQERIRDIKPLKVSHIEKHRPALAYFLKQNDKLIREKQLSVDVLGGNAYLHIIARHIKKEPVLSGNILLHEPTQKLRLIDTDMLRASPFNISHPREIGFAIISYIGYLLTKLTLNHYDIM